MRMESIGYENLNSYNSLFLNFIKNNVDLISNRFPNNLENAIDKTSYDISLRKIIIEVIKKSSNEIDLSDKQKKNLDDLANENSFTITTGQQIGFLGGALYTIYKIITTISECKKYKEKFPKSNFIPIFWLEDNDHDQLEASESFYLSKDKSIKNIFSKENIDNKEHLVSAYLENSEFTLSEINKFFDEMPFSEYKDEIEEKVNSFYSTKYQKDSFLKLLNSMFSDYGVLFLSANELRKTGIYKEIILKELISFKTSNQSIANANEFLISNNYPVQTQNSGTKLFYHIENRRYKINFEKVYYIINNEKYSEIEILKIANDFPEKFSPNVLLRCIVQEYCLPNLAYIAGPGEINYWAQTKELFEFFDVKMPLIIPRHSATLINSKIEKNLSKLGLNANYFYKTFDFIETHLKEKHHSDKLDLLFDNTKIKISEIFSELKNQGILIDKTLEQTVDGSLQKTLNFIEILEKKFEAANHKLSNEENLKHRETSNYIFPNNKLQERVFNIVSILNSIGYENFKKIISELINSDNYLHQIIYLD